MTMTPEQTLSFFRSVIQSGEPWTETCEAAYKDAIAHIAGMVKAVAYRYWNGSSYAYPNRPVPGEESTPVYLAPPIDIAAVREVIPISWLDPLLTGPNAVIGKPPYGCQDIERLLRALSDKLTAALPKETP